MQTVKVVLEQAAQAANDKGQDKGRYYINQMRAMLGRCSIASKFDQLTEQQKAMVLYGARLRPSSLISTPFESMTDDEREAIRLSLLAVTELANKFQGMPMGRANVMPIKYRKPKQIHPQPQPKTEAINFEELTQFAAELAGEMKQLKVNQK